MKRKWLGLFVVAGVFLFLSSGCYAAQEALPKPIKESGPGKLYKLDGVKMVVLSGTFREMGRQYGALLGEEISRLYETAVKEAFVKKGMFTQEELDAFAENTFKTMPMRQKELVRGMAETSGLSRQKVILAGDMVMVQILARKKFGGNVTSCSSAAAWGKYTVDGKVLTARNYDFPDLFRILAKDYALIVVYKPTDGSNAMAGLGLTGSISFVDAFTGKGIYVEVNNAVDSAGFVLFNSRTQAMSQLMNMLFDADDTAELYNLASGTRFSYSFIMMAADASSASYYEVAHWDLRRREAKDTTAIAAANQFDDPAWGILSLPSPAVWYSSLRENTMLNFAKSAPAKGADEKYMMSVLDIPLFNKDGSFNKGAAVLEKLPNDDEVTVWQVITRPADMKMWVRIPTLTGWVAIDLKEIFGK